MAFYSDTDMSSSDSDVSDVTINSTDSEATPDSETECDVVNKDSVTWLKNHYAYKRHVAIRFGDSEQTFVLPHDFLVRNFKYFRVALQEVRGQPVFIEGDPDHTIHVEEIKASAFSNLVHYLRKENSANPYRLLATSIDLLLDAVITADYLNLSAPDLTFEDFEGHMLQNLGYKLLRDHRKVRAKHLMLVGSHNAFKSGRVWSLLAQAGVRPYLQLFMLEGSIKQSKIGGQCPSYAIGLPAVWLSTLKHHRKLRAGNDQYALKVMEEVSNARRLDRDADFQRRGKARLVLDGPFNILHTDPLYRGLAPELAKQVRSRNDYLFAA